MQDAEPHGSRRAAILRLTGLAIVVGGVFLAATLSGHLPSAGEVRDWGDGLGPLGPLAFIPLSAALGCLLVPGPVLAGSAGLLFGTALGTPVALAATVLTAVSQMLITRYVAGARVGSLLPKRVRRIDDVLERRGFFAVLYIRLTPGVPFHLVNYGAGLTRLRVRDMAAGTAIGAIPRSFAYVALGGHLDNLRSPEAKAAIALIVVMGAAGLVLARYQVRRERER
ncbi:MAG: hypothetical protein QOE08_77 [Thermoleophilaceae bacterium]|nr:hypothetical protein [Thermoleophilaceae bacterium]